MTDIEKLRIIKTIIERSYEYLSNDDNFAWAIFISIESIIDYEKEKK